MKHGNEFDRVAIYGNKKWQKIGARVGLWFISGEVKYCSKRCQGVGWVERSDTQQCTDGQTFTHTSHGMLGIVALHPTYGRTVK